MRLLQEGIRSEESGLLRAAIDAMPHNVALLDPDGRVVMVNEAWLAFGRENGLKSPGGGIGVDYVRLCRRAEDEQAGEVARQLRRALRGRLGRFSLVYPCHSPFERRWFRLDARAFDHQGARHVLMVHEDVTDQQEALAELRQDARRRRVDGSAYVLALATGRRRPPLGFIDLSRVLDAVHHAFRAQWPEDRRMPKDIEAPLPVLGDARSLFRAVWELLWNAAEATSERGTIALSAGVQGDRVLVIVADDGHGMDASHADEIGIGLMLADEVARLHEGELSVVSEGPAHGTTAVLSLPLARGIKGVKE